MSKKEKQEIPPCINNLSFKAFLKNSIKQNRKTYNIEVKGIIGLSKIHPDSKKNLQTKIAEYHEMIIKNCYYLGKGWGALGCNISQIDVFCEKFATPIIQEFIKGGCFDEIHKESEEFAKYLAIIKALSAKLVEFQTEATRTTGKLLHTKDDAQEKELFDVLKILLENQKGKRVALVIHALQRKGYIEHIDRNITDIFNYFSREFHITGSVEAIRQQYLKEIDPMREEVIKDIEMQLP